jgi:hypothetical protein
MSTKDTMGSANLTPFFSFGKEQTEAAIALQQELLEAYQTASTSWLDRVKSEAELWSELAAKLSEARSIPERLEVYTKCISRQMQMTAEDGKRLLDDCQQITQKIAKSLTNGRPTGRA